MSVSVCVSLSLCVCMCVLESVCVWGQQCFRCLVYLLQQCVMCHYFPDVIIIQML